MVETLIEIMIFSTLVFAGIGAIAGAFVYVGHLLAEEAVEPEDAH